MIEKFMQWFKKNLDLIIEVIFLSLVILAPLFFDRRLGIVFSLSKATIIRILTLIISGLFITKLLLNKNSFYVRTSVDLPIITYLLCTLAAVINSINIYVSFVGSYGRYEGFITILNYALLFFLAVQIITTYESRRRVMMASVISALAMAIYGIIQRLNLDPYEWGGVITNERIIATIGQPNFLAAYIAMAILFGFGLILSMDGNKAQFIIKNEPRNKKLKPSTSINLKEIYFQLKMGVYFLLVPAVFIYSLYFFKSSDNFSGWILSFLIIVSITIYFSFNIEKVDSRILKSLIIISLIFHIIGLFSTQSRGGILGFLCGFIIFIILSGRKCIFENKKLWIAAGVAGFILLSAFSINLAKRFSLEVKIKQDAGIIRVEEKKIEDPSKPIKKKPRLELEGAAGSRIETWTSAAKLISDRPIFGVGPEVIKMIFPQYETPYFRFKEGFHVKQDRCHNETLDIALTKGTVTLFVYIILIYLIFKSGIAQIKKNPKDSPLVGCYLGAISSYIVQNQFSFGVVAITSLFWIIIGMVIGLNSSDASYIKIYEKEGKKQANVFLLVMWAVIAILMVISVFPYLSDRYFKSAKTYSDSNMLKEAEKDFKIAIKITPYEPSTYTHYGMAKINLGQNDVNEINDSIAIFKKGQGIDPYNADNFYMAGRAYLFLYEKGDNSALAIAKGLSERALKIDPYYAEAYQNLGIIHERMGNTSEAVKLYEKAFLANPTLSFISSTLYSYYSSIGEPLHVMDVFEKSLSENPNNAELLIMMGDIFNDLNLFEKAKEKYFDALSINDKRVNVNLNAKAKALAGLGIAHLKSGDSDSAFSKLQEAIIIDPSEALVHNGLGLYYLKKGDKMRAREEFMQAQTLGSQNSFIKKMLSKIK